MQDSLSVEKGEIEISIIIPLWNEEGENIRETYLGLSEVLTEFARTYEIIFVDDGSSNRIFVILRSLHQSDKNIKIVRLSRNYGQAAAILAGFQHAKGKTIVTMDIDLQYAPEDIPKLIDKIDQGFDMVSGWRMNRQDPILIRKIPSYIINKFIEKKTGVRFHDWGCSFNAVKSDLVAKLKDFGRTARFIKPLLVHLANSPTEVEIQHRLRKVGRSKYDLLRLMKLALDILINLSLKPKLVNKSLFVIKEVIG